MRRLLPLRTAQFQSQTSERVNYYMLSTPFQEEVYLGYPSSEPLQKPTIETTYFSGLPLFIESPPQKLLRCSTCPSQTLTFLCQVFCPLEASHCYNRVLYVFFCSKCQREFRCLKQQSSENQKIEPRLGQVRVIGQKMFEISSQSIEIKELEGIRSKAKRDCEQEIIEEKEQQEFEEEEAQQVDMKEIEKYQKGDHDHSLEEKLGQQVQSLKVMTQNMQQTKKEDKDPIFQCYRKIMRDLDSPIILYSNIPIPYNKDPINPKHHCPFCKAKMVPELQITEKILLLSPKLVGQDWGSILIFTCSGSCKDSIEECVVVQYQVDAVKDSEVSVLKKRQKNRRKKNKKKEGEKEGKSEEEEEQEVEVSKEMKEEQEGDWD